MPGIQLGFLNNNLVAYFDFNAYPSLDRVQNNCNALQTTLKSSGAKGLIIDFRGNGGGDFYTGLAFSACLLPLDQFDWLQGAFILIDSGTFSASMSNAVQFKRIFNGTLMGMPTGGDPNQFSENFSTRLPNSKRKISLSVRYYPFIFEPTDALYPDVRIDTSWQNYQHGIDPVLVKTLELGYVPANSCIAYSLCLQGYRRAL